MSRADAPRDNPPLAIATILAAVFALSLGDALIKLTSSSIGIWQIFVLRSILAGGVLVGLLMWRAPEALAWPRAFVWTMLRSLMLVVMWVAYYAALPHLKLPIAAAAYYTLPIFITLFSALLLGEKIRLLGWCAALVGFLGVVLILRPSVGDFNAYALLPLVAAVLYALAMILTRSKCRDEHPLMLSLSLNVAFLAVGGLVSVVIVLVGPNERAFLTASWEIMDLRNWMAIAVMAVAILIGSLGAAVAYQRARPAVVGTFDFAYVGFALIWGAVIFSELPDLQALVGIGLIVVTGAMSLRQ